MTAESFTLYWVIKESRKELIKSMSVYYIDSLGGNDKNCGTSAGSPWKSLEKANGQLLEPGDELRFKCGGKWKGTLTPCGNGSRELPVRISSYGEGRKPEIDGGGAYAGVLLEGFSHYRIENLKVMNRAGDRAVRQGICVIGRAEGITEDITIQNCEITQVCGQNKRDEKAYCSMYWNGAIYITIPGRSSSKNHLHHIHILNNYIHDVITSGIRVNQEEDFIKDIYHTCIIIRGNHIERTGCDGIIAANSISPLIERNRCYDAGALGTREDTQLIAGIWVCAASNALIQWNEVAGTRLFMNDGTAFDTDWGNEGTTVFQYNYSHDNEGGFWLDCSSVNYNINYEKTVIRYNVSVRDGRGIALYCKNLPVEFYGNIFAFDKAASVCVEGDGTAFLFANNQFMLKEDPVDNWGKSIFMNNYYIGKACPRDKGKAADKKINILQFPEYGKDKIEWLQENWELLHDLTATMDKTALHSALQRGENDGKI